MNPSVKKINKICLQIKKLTPEDFQAVEEMIQEQTSYIHPLKNAKAAKYHELGEHNRKVLAHLKELQHVVKSLIGKL